MLTPLEDFLAKGGITSPSFSSHFFSDNTKPSMPNHYAWSLQSFSLLAGQDQAPSQFKPTDHLVLGLACHHSELAVQVHVPKSRNLKHLILQAASRGRGQGSPQLQPWSEPSL